MDSEQLFEHYHLTLPRFQYTLRLKARVARQVRTDQVRSPCPCPAGRHHQDGEALPA